MSSPSTNPFSKFFPSSRVTSKSKSIPRKENVRNNTNRASQETNSSSKDEGKTGSGANQNWLNTKKRGRDDEIIAHDKTRAEQTRKNFAAKRRRVQQGVESKNKPPRKNKKASNNCSSSEEEEEDDGSMNEFIAHSDEDEECSNSSSSEEETSSFFPRVEKRSVVKKVTLQSLAKIQIKNNSRSKQKTKAPPKKIAKLSAKYLNRSSSVSAESISSVDDDDDIPPASNFGKGKIKEDSNKSSTTAMSSPDIVFKKRSVVAAHVSSSSDDEKNKNQKVNTRLIIQSDDEDDDIPIGKKLSSDFEDDVILLSNDDDEIAPKATAQNKRLQKQKVSRTIDLCEDEKTILTPSDEESKKINDDTILIHSDEETYTKKTTKRLKKARTNVITKISTDDPFSESEEEDVNDNEDDNGDDNDDQFVEEADREAGSVLTSANQLSAQILKRMREWCFGSSASSSSVPEGMIVDGALALYKQDVDSNDSNIFITKSILKDILSPDIQLKEYQWIGVNWMALLHTMKCNVEGKETNVNGVLADEMGLGKTIQTIAFLAWLKYYRTSSGDGKGNKPHIVIVPASVLSNWLNEFRKVCPDLIVVKYHGSAAQRSEIKEDLRQSLPNSYEKKPLDIVLTTFSYFSSEKSDDRSFLRRFKFDYMVVDEAHCLKNPKGSRYKNMDKFVTEHRLLLTGTPVQNSAEELMSLLCFLMPLFNRNGGGGGGFSDNDENDGGARMLHHFVTLEGGGSKRENYNKLKQLFSPFVLRRKKSDCLKQMLPKIRKLEIVPLTGEVRSTYDSIISSHIERQRQKINNDTSSGPGTTSHLFTELRKAANHPLLLRNRHKSPDAIQHLSSILFTSGYFGDQCNLNLVKKELEKFSDYDVHCAVMTLIDEKPHLNNELSRYIATEDDLFASPKFSFLQTLLPSLIQNKHRILIFSQWTRCLDLMEHLMSNLEIEFMRLDGSTSVSTRQRLIDEFTNEERYKVFLLSTRAGGLGINLTCADTCILHDLDFNPFNDLQAEDRCHRIGQTKPVTVIKMVAADTVETDIHSMQERKARMNNAILETPDDGIDTTSTRKNNKEGDEKEVSTIIQTAMDRYLLLN